MTDDSPALFETIVRAAADAIVYADTTGAIRFWNAGAERIFGYAAGEATGQSLDLIIPEMLADQPLRGLAAR
jgi:PAS domain S-box-containing protein